MKKFMLTIATVVSASIIFAGCASKDDTTKVSESTEQVVDTVDTVEDVAEEPVVTEEPVVEEDPVEDVVTDDTSTEDTDVAEDDTIDLSFLMGDYEDVDRSSLTETMDFDWATGYYDPDYIALASCVKDGGVKDDDEIYAGVTFKAYCDGLNNVLDHPVNREMLRRLISVDAGEKYKDYTDGLTIVTILSDYLYFVENPTTVEVYGYFDKEEDSFFITVNDEFTFKLTLVDKTKILINDEESDFPDITEDVRNSYKSKIETALGL